MKLEECGAELGVAVEGAGGRAQRLAAEGGALVLSEGGARLRVWPLHAVAVKPDLTSGAVLVEAGGETLTLRCAEAGRAALLQLAAAAGARAAPGAPTDAALAALLDDAEPGDADAERRVRRLAERLARLDALNVAGMLAAATEGGGARLADRLEAGGAASGALAARLARLEALTRAAPAALHARSGAARADAAARALLTELTDIYDWLDNPALQDLDALPEISLGTAEGRARALAAAEALRDALDAARAGEARLRLGAVRERLRRLARARDALAAALARHLNNALIHLGNEATAATAAPRARAHHAELAPYAPFMRWLKCTDEKAYAALLRVYCGAWARVYERDVRAAAERAKQELAHAPPERVDALLDEVLTLVESTCNAEQDFCTQFFCLDVDARGAGGGGSGGSGASGASGGGAEARRASDAARRLRAELFPALEQELVALVQHIEKHEPYGAMRALACVGRRVLRGGEGEAEAGAGEARWARAALAAVAVAAKRGADRVVAERLAALPDAVKQAARKPKCGILSFIPELEELSAVCEAIFARGRRADLDRWYLALGAAQLRAIATASHPRTPRAVLQLENYHRLHACVSALRVPALDALRRDARARYADALRAYVTQQFGRPLEKLATFFEGVAEAVAGGVREDEVCYRAAYSKHELRRLLALYPAHEVRKSLHRLYRTVEKHLSEEGGLLQVVWRAMQEEFIAQHVALQARIAACYPGAGLSLPLTTQDILDAFSDIAREH
ncbi:exocyst complex component 1 [Maniola jurtina]|uniref:exocyst complex component 1 n=1 Tax=Maniola jurtina TaxID=191418 RepID=UPI001E68CA7F|nr:exocyst complex component 1 [Maniola jurtina]